MNYPISEKYCTPELMSKIMGPNPMKLQEELLLGHCIPEKSVVCDLGCGQGLTSLLLAKEYGFTVYATDLWCDPEKNRLFFEQMGLSSEEVIPVKADARDLPFEKEFFDAVVSTDSYNFFGVDSDFLDEKLLPFVREGGYIYITCPGMKKDCHDNLPPELLLSWTPEQMALVHDADYWRAIVSHSKNAEIVEIGALESNEEVWAEWLALNRGYAISDRKAIDAGACKYLNFVKIVLRKKSAQ